MLGDSFSKRKFDVFVSYDHGDAAVVAPFVRWLESAGFKVWHDSDSFRGGEKVAAALSQHLGECRAFIAILSKASVQSTWVRSEVQTALHEVEESPGFTVLGLLIEPCDIPREWGNFRTRKWIEAPAGQLSLQAGWDVLKALHPAGDAQVDKIDVYVSCGWRENEFSFAERACQVAARKGARLIADAADQRHFIDDRVRGLMQGCSAHLVLLPDRSGTGQPPEREYKYLRRELELGKEAGVPQLLVCQSLAALPADDLFAGALEASAPDDTKLAYGLDRLLEDAIAPPAPKHAFFASEYGALNERNRLVKSLVESLTAIPCVMGSDFTGEQLRARLIDHVRRAQFVIADLASAKNAEEGSLKINLNTCVEAGIAIGADVPLFLFCRDPEAANKTAKLPFMFRDHQIDYYQEEVQLLAAVHRHALPFRRRVLNHELG